MLDNDNKKTWMVEIKPHPSGPDSQYMNLD